MAWLENNAHGTAGNKTAAATTLNCPVAAQVVPVGMYLAAFVVTDNLGTVDGVTNYHTAMSDTRGHAWTKLKEVTNANAAAAAGVTVSIWMTTNRISTQLDITTDSVTVTFSAGLTAKAMGLRSFSLTAGSTWDVPAGAFAGTPTDAAATKNASVVSGLASQEYLALVVDGIESFGTDTYTNDVDYTGTTLRGTTGGVTDSNVSMRHSFRIFVGTGDTHIATTSVAADWSSLLVFVREVVSAPATQTILSGRIASGSVVRGPATVAPSGSVPIASGRVAPTSAVRGPVTVAASGAAPLTPGRVASSSVVRGATPTGAGSSPLSAGRVSPTSVVRGANVSPGPTPLSAGRINATSIVRGPVVAAAGSAALPAGRVVSGSAVRGPSLNAAGATGLSPGRVSPTSLVRGPSVGASGNVPIPAGRITAASVVRGPVIVPGGVAPLSPGRRTSGATVYGPTITRQASFVLNEEFDTDLSAYVLTGTPAIVTAGAIHGPHSLQINATGASYLKRTVSAGQTIEVFRFLYKHTSTPVGGIATLYDVGTVAAKNGSIRVTTANVLQAIISGGGAVVNGPTLVVGQEYLIEGRFDCSTATFRLDWRVDNVAKTQASYVHTAASELNQERLGNLNAGTANYLVDSWMISRDATQYPLGGPPPATNDIAAGRIPSGSVVHGPEPFTPVGAGRYSGFYGVAVRTVSADLTATFNANPWLDGAGCYIKWNVLEPTYNAALALTAIANTMKACIDKGKFTILRIEMGYAAPDWLYAANATGVVQKITVQADSQVTPANPNGAYDIPVPWDANLRKHVQRLLPKIETFLQTTYNGKKYADVVAHFALSMATNIGTEMTIGPEGRAANTAAWDAISTSTQRRQWIEDAWFNNLVDYKALCPSVRPSMAIGPIFGDGRQGAKNVALRATKKWSAGECANILAGPTDMRVDKPGAKSYTAWSAEAAAALDYFRQVGLTPWSQSAGESWFNSGTFTGGRAAAKQKAYLQESTNRFRCVICESNTGLIGADNLEAWAKDVLSPAIKGLATPTQITPGRRASGAIVRGPKLQLQALPTLRPGRIASTAIVRGPSMPHDPPVPDPAQYLIRCYTRGASLSTFDGHRLIQHSNPVYEVDIS